VIECAFFGEEARFHHVGLAVSSIREVCSECEVVVERTQGVRLGFVNLSGVTLELLEPLDEGSPIARSLREGVKLLHLCYEVPHLETALRHCEEAGFHRISQPVLTRALGNRRVVWLFSKHYGLVELLETAERSP
jgi:methylmalonyl-CoA/ethylmalonyl-CoA epimerase